jgi:hypothetical protein
MTDDLAPYRNLFSIGPQETENKSLWDEFSSSFSASGNNMLYGLTQLTRETTGNDILPDVQLVNMPQPKQTWTPEWVSQQLGSGLAFALPLLGAAAITKGRFLTSAKDITLGASTLDAGIVGGVTGFALTPTTDDQGKDLHGSEFWKSKFQQTASMTVSYATMAGIENIGKSANPGIALRMARTTTAGYAGGFLHAQANSGFTSTFDEANREATQWAAGGALFRGTSELTSLVGGQLKSVRSKQMAETQPTGNPLDESKPASVPKAKPLDVDPPAGDVSMTTSLSSDTVIDRRSGGQNRGSGLDVPEAVSSGLETPQIPEAEPFMRLLPPARTPDLESLIRIRNRNGTTLGGEQQSPQMRSFLLDLARKQDLLPEVASNDGTAQLGDVPPKVFSGSSILPEGPLPEPALVKAALTRPQLMQILKANGVDMKTGVASRKGYIPKDELVRLFVENRLEIPAKDS